MGGGGGGGKAFPPSFLGGDTCRSWSSLERLRILRGSWPPGPLATSLADGPGNRLFFLPRRHIQPCHLQSFFHGKYPSSRKGIHFISVSELYFRKSRKSHKNSPRSNSIAAVVRIKQLDSTYVRPMELLKSTHRRPGFLSIH